MLRLEKQRKYQRLSMAAKFSTLLCHKNTDATIARYQQHLFLVLVNITATQTAINRKLTNHQIGVSDNLIVFQLKMPVPSIVEINITNWNDTKITTTRQV